MEPEGASIRYRKRHQNTDRIMPATDPEQAYSPSPISGLFGQLASDPAMRRFCSGAVTEEGADEAVLVREIAIEGQKFKVIAKRLPVHEKLLILVLVETPEESE